MAVCSRYFFLEWKILRASWHKSMILLSKKSKMQARVFKSEYGVLKVLKPTYLCKK